MWNLVQNKKIEQKLMLKMIITFFSISFYYFWKCNILQHIKLHQKLKSANDVQNFCKMHYSQICPNLSFAEFAVLLKCYKNLSSVKKTYYCWFFFCFLKLVNFSDDFIFLYLNKNYVFLFFFVFIRSHLFSKIFFDVMFVIFSP